MKLFSRTLPLIALTLAALAASAQAEPTLIITDNSAISVDGSVALHNPIGHWQEFGTTLTANVHDAPEDNDEIEIGGPIYKWTGGRDHVTFSSNNQGELIDDQKTIEVVTQSPMSEAFAAGNNDISIQCKATYALLSKKVARF